jgi:hypothetical protein
MRTMCSVFLLLQSFALLQLRQTPEELRRRRFLRILQQLDLQSSPFWPRLLAQSFRPVVLLECAKVPARQNLLAAIRKQRERSTLLQFDAARRTICHCRLPLRFQRMLAQIPWKRREPFTSYGGKSYAEKLCRNPGPWAGPQGQKLYNFEKVSVLYNERLQY